MKKFLFIIALFAVLLPFGAPDAAAWGCNDSGTVCGAHISANKIRPSYYYSGGCGNYCNNNNGCGSNCYQNNNYGCGSYCYSNNNYNSGCGNYCNYPQTNHYAQTSRCYYCGRNYGYQQSYYNNGYDYQYEFNAGINYQYQYYYSR